MQTSKTFKQMALFSTPQKNIPASTAADRRFYTWDIQKLFRKEVFVYTEEKKGEWYLSPGEYGSWDKILECGRSYMVGESTSMSAYLRGHTSKLSDWQERAYAFCLQNPNLVLKVETRTHHWRIYQRGEYVEFSLPHQDHGGERHYVSRDGKKKVLVNVD